MIHPMTKTAYLVWFRTVAAMLAADGPRAAHYRDWSETIRPFDAELADAYVRVAEAQEAIRALVAKRARDQ